MSETIKLEDPEIDTGTEVSLVESCITSYHDSKSKIASHKASKIGVGRGFLSHIVRLSLEWSPKDSRLPKSVVLKLATDMTLKGMGQTVKEEYKKKMEEEGKTQEKYEEGHPLAEKSAEQAKLEQDGMNEFLLTSQKGECAFYDFIRDKKLDVRIPICYYSTIDAPGVFIFEDLSHGQNRDIYDGLTLENCLQIVESLAALHAFCVKTSEWKTFPDLHEHGKKFMDSVYDSHMKGLKQTVEGAKKTWPEHFDPIIDRYPELGDKVADYKFVDDLNEEYGLPPVIVHGDLHLQNMMFEKANADNLLAIFDWQSVHTGCLVEDLGRLLCLSADADIRRVHLEEILYHYYNHFCKHLGKVKVPFAYDTLRRAFDRIVRYSSGIAVMALIVFAVMDMKAAEESIRDAKVSKQVIRAKCLLEDCLELMDSGKA